MFGITGEIGIGKSTLADALNKNHQLPIHILELDEIRRHILWESEHPKHVDLRKKLAQAFHLPVQTEQAWLNREDFTVQIFSSPESLRLYSILATPVIYSDIHIHFHGKYDVLVWTHLIEEGYDDLCDFIIEVKSHTPVERDSFLEYRFEIQKQVFQPVETKKQVITYYRNDDLNALIKTIKAWYANT